MSDKEHEIYQVWVKENNIPTNKHEHDLIKQGNKLLIVVVCEDAKKVQSRTVTSLMNMDIPENFLVSIDYAPIDRMQTSILDFNNHNYVLVIKDGLQVSEQIFNEMISSNQDMVVVKSSVHDDFGCVFSKRSAIYQLTEFLSKSTQYQLNTGNLAEKIHDSKK
jgi:hypothetical protein